MLDAKVVFLNCFIKIRGKMVNKYILSRLTINKKVKRTYLINFVKVRVSFAKKETRLKH